MKKILLIIFILALLVNFSFGKEKRFRVSFLSGLNHVFKFGSEDDYAIGKNDFPVIPAHTPANFGAGFAVFFIKNIGIELEGRYILTSRVTLLDPSDKDTIKINTARHFALTVNFFCQFLSGKFRPYLILGSGFDKLLPKGGTYTTEYGYEVDLMTPEKTIDPTYHVGCGIDYFLNSSLGARFDVRYVFIFVDPNYVRSVNVMFGAFIKL